MSYYIVQHGSALSFLTTAGTITALTLPSGVTSTGGTPRFAIFDREVVIVNAFSENIAVSRGLGTRILTPKSPSGAVSLAAGAAGTLNGTFRVKATFVVKDAFGNILAESGFGPESVTSAALVNQLLVATNVPLSSQTITARKLYRTTSSPPTVGATYYPWIDVDGNVLNTVTDGLSDAALNLLSAPTDLGSPPVLSLVTEWKKRLWGVGKDDIDTLRYSGPSKNYAWPALNTFPIAPLGSDSRGVTALIRRRDELGVARRNAIHKITATAQTFDIRSVVEGIGVESQESVVVVNDEAYFLGHSYGQFGIYRWGNNGIINISNGAVYSWFNTDTYFNRGRFDNTFGRFNATTGCYELHVAAVGSSVEDRWIAFDLNRGEWYGPHKTAALTPTCAGQFQDSSDLPLTVVGGSNGFIYKLNQTAYADDGNAIDFDVDSTFHNASAPDIEHFYDSMSLLSRVEPTATSLSITSHVGRLNSATYYRDEVVRSLPAAYYRLDETGGATATDSSGNGLNGTYAGTPGYSATGAIAEGNTAVTFSGDDSVSVVDNALLRPLGLSVEAWVFPTSYASTFNTILAKADASWGSGYGMFVTSGATEIKFFINGYSTRFASTTPPTLSTWTHVVGTYDQKVIRIYINGILMNSYDYPSSISHSLTDLKIGAHAGGNAWVGKLDEVTVHGRAISPDEILRHYRLGVGTVMLADLTLGRENLDRLGAGAMAQLNFRLNTLNKGVRLYGYEIPFIELGRR